METFPKQAVFIKRNRQDGWASVCGIDRESIRIVDDCLTFKEALDLFTMSLDFGETWQPVGVEELC